MTHDDFLKYKKYYEYGNKYLKRMVIDYFRDHLLNRCEALKEYKKKTKEHPGDVAIKSVVKNLQEEVNFMNKVIKGV